MDREELDFLYHDLRKLCVTNDITQKEAVGGIVSHLTKPSGDYNGLLRFLDYYGEKYVLPTAVDILHLHNSAAQFSRIVELGSGLGWLGRGLSGEFDVPTLFCDKRQWMFTDVVADIESKNGIKRVLDELEDGDLIVMSELIHCIDDPHKVFEPFTRWPILVIEYNPKDKEFKRSYDAQIEKFNCEPFSSIEDVFPDSGIIESSTDTHGIWLVLPK